MKIRRFYGKDMREALKQVKDELGGDAVIMSNKKHADGIEIVAAYDKEPELQLKAKKTSNPATQSLQKTPTLSEIIGDTAPDSLKALLEKQSKSQVAPEPTKPSTLSTPANDYDKSSKISEEREDHQQQALKEMRQELSSLRNILQFQVSGLIEQEKIVNTRYMVT